MAVLERLADLLALPSRHDVVLTGMPVAFLLTYLLGTQLFTSHSISVAAASLASATLVVDGLFRHPPHGESSD